MGSASPDPRFWLPPSSGCRENLNEFKGEHAVEKSTKRLALSNSLADASPRAHGLECVHGDL